jgi:hypothetical protein
MLRAGHATVGYSGPRVGSSRVERHVVNALGAPARAGGLQPPLGFRYALRRCSLRVPAPHQALRARLDSLSDASLRVRSQARRSAEVRPAPCLSVLSSHRACRVAGAAGWRAHHGVGEAQGRGWRAVCCGQRRGPAADSGRLQGSLGGTGAVGRAPVAGDATAGEKLRS